MSHTALGKYVYLRLLLIFEHGWLEIKATKKTRFIISILGRIDQGQIKGKQAQQMLTISFHPLEFIYVLFVLQKPFSP